MRKTYGNTWWGERWLGALADIDLSNRLPRGKSYANTGKVIDLSVKGQTITGKVRGTNPMPYRVKIEISKFTELQKMQLIEHITRNPIYLSQLLNRRLPERLAEYCLKAGIRLFPRNWHDMSFDCSCPDYATPCKHEAAVVYLFANEIDKDPFLIFKLQDLDLLAELEKRNYTIADAHKGKTASVEELWVDYIDYSDETPDCLPILERIDYTQIPPCGDRLFAILSPQPPFYSSGDFKKIIEKHYETIARRYAKYKQGATEDDENAPFFYRTSEMNIILSDEMEFKEITFFSEDDILFQTQKIDFLVEWLNTAPLGQLPNYSPPIIALCSIYHFAIKLLQQSAYVPQVIKSARERYGIRWLPATVSEEVSELLQHLEALMPEGSVVFNYVLNGKRSIKMCKTGEQAAVLTSLFLRHFIAENPTTSESFYEKDVELLFFFEDYIHLEHFDSKETPQLVQLWLSKFFMTNKEFVPLIKVEESDGYFSVRLFVENQKDPTQAPINVEELFQTEGLEMARISALQDIALLIEHYPDIENLLQSDNYALYYSFQEFTTILLNILPVIKMLGIRILLPKSLQKLARPKISMEILGEKGETKLAPSGMSLDNLLQFNWKIAIGNQLVSADEFSKMVDNVSGIVKIKDEFVLIDEKELKAILEKLKNPPKVTAQEIFQAALSESYEGAKVFLDANAQTTLNELLHAEKVSQPQNLLATLRPYQERGYEWLYKNSKIGFGSLIADDMGLGKTLQVITMLLKFKQEGVLEKQKALAVLPTTLLSNWQKEIQKFAPELNAQIFHGTNRQLDLENNDVILTTYGVARAETSELAKIKWAVLILDEAQNIKNPETAQSRAIKKLKSDIRIAMTGTPVENRLSEYWSIFDFINKGYLFGLKKFNDKFARPIELDRDKIALEHFQKITAPFVLRRVKTDKSIIQDLPDKIETDQICHLTKTQAALYQSVVDNMFEAVEKASSIERRGLILKLLTALKQICNHPSQFLKAKTIETEESGKTVLLIDLLRRIFNAHEKVLIFTQYRQMGDLLVQLIKDELGENVAFLHGGESRKSRDTMVENFQNKPYVKALLVSLKAGGTGLNLTAASNVIHFDLWWNPAVEAQATDRAYRIGQKLNVQVHRFITEKTFEEKINKLIQSKKELANLTVANGENWLGDLSNDDLKALVRLE